MMTFSASLKNELLRAECFGEQRQAESYGMLLFSRLFSLRQNAVTTENRLFAQELSGRIGELGALCEVRFSLRRKGEAFHISIPFEGEREKLLSAFGYSGRELSLRIRPQLLKNAASQRAFLRGAFLSAGSVSDPSRDYHLEIASAHRALISDLASLLLQNPELDLSPGQSSRAGKSVVYLKDSEKISDFLTFIGAPQSAMELMQAKMLKEVRNYVNRKSNFDTANIDKTVKAAVEQNLAIEKVIEKKGIDYFPPSLREIAALRLRNPEMSLRELSEELSLSRSGVNHRLKKILEIAEDLDD